MSTAAEAVSQALPKWVEDLQRHMQTHDGDEPAPFDRAAFLASLPEIIQRGLEPAAKRQRNKTISYDIALDTPRLDRQRQNALAMKQLNMSIGKIWQRIFGKYDHWIDLGDKCPFDLMSVRHKIIIELKNRDNTDNSSSRRMKHIQLAECKRLFPDYRCIYATLNAKTEQ